MRQYFKPFITLALLSLSITSCNNDFDDDMHYTYPNEVETGTWVVDGSAAKNYIVNFSVDEQGKHVCDIVESVPSVGVNNTFAGGKYSYNPKTGLIHVDYEQSPFGDNVGAVADFSILSDGKSMIGGIYEKAENGLNPKTEFRLVSCDTLSILGNWNVGKEFTISIFPDFTATLKFGDKTEQASFSQKGNDAVVTSESGNTYKFHVNADRNVVYTNNGTETVLTRIVGSINDWRVIAKGTYTNWLFSQLVGPQSCDLIYSDSRREGRIKDFALPGSELSFYWIIGKPTVVHTGTMYDTMYDHEQPGIPKTRTFGTPVAITEDGQTALYDAEQGAFFFGHQYILPGIGGFGANIDVFAIEEVVE